MKRGHGGVVHPLEPFFDISSKILILGTMPSPKSRETGFYYGHPQNRFWKVLAGVFQAYIPVTMEEKKLFLASRCIALWDVLKSCEITGASDASIKKPVVNDINRVLSISSVSAIFTTGTAAARLYEKYCRETTGIDCVCLPSTSPANCARHTVDTLVKEYKIILDYL